MMANPIPRYPIPNMDLPLPPPPTMTLQHHQLSVTSPPTIQLQAPPPPRNMQPNTSQPQRPPTSTPQPKDKSQEDWLRDSGHSSLEEFMDYYGFTMSDPEDVRMGKGFLDQIRKQEQEVWEQAQAQAQTQNQQQATPQQQQQRPQMQNRTYSSTTSMISRPPSNNSNTSQSMTRYMEEQVAPSSNTYNIKTYHQQQQQQPQQHIQQTHISPYRSQPPLQQQQQQQQNQMKQMQMQIPRSNGAGDQMVSNRFHTAAVNRAFSENVLNAYGLKAWEMDNGAAKMGGEFVRYER